MKYVIFGPFLVGAILGSAGNASANSVVCSSADQSLSYSRQTSNGGAPLDTRTLKYQGLTQTAWGYDSPSIEWSLADRKDIDTQSSGGVTTNTFVGLATGAISAESQTLNFSKTVLCEEVLAPVCQLCP